MISSIFVNKLDPSDLQKVIEVSDWLGIDANWLCAVIYFETGKTMRPDTKNKIGSVGLIQFTRDKKGVEYKTIQGKRYLLNDLALMTFKEQMEIVRLYFAPFKNRMKNFLDVYLVVFFPVALNKPDDYVLQTSSLSASIIAKQNPIFDRNKDLQITRLEVTSYFSKWFGTAFSDIEAKKKCCCCNQTIN